MPDTTDRTIIDQIGRGNYLAISGGRYSIIKGEPGEVLGVRLPVAYGYKVDVILDRGSDTYIVRRVFKRAGVEKIMGEATNVYASEVGEMAYRASCYHDEWQTA